MKTILHLCCFIVLLGLTNICQAQMVKGQWLTDGNMQFQTFDIGKSTEVSITDLNVGVGLMLTNKWALGGGVGMRFVRLRGIISNRLWMRYYFHNQAPISLFSGLRWNRETLNRARNQQQRPSKRVTDSYFLQLGLNYFLNSHLTLENVFNFGFLQTTTSNEVTQIGSGSTAMDLRLRLLLDGNRKMDPFEHAIPLERGQWAIGGYLAFNPRTQTEEGLSKVFDLRPAVSYLFFRHFLLGMELDVNYANGLRSIDLGALLYSRYFVPLGRNKFLFPDAGIGYTSILVKEGGTGSVFIADHLRVFRLGLGYTIFVSPQMSFDIFTYRTWNKKYLNFPSKSGRKSYTTKGVNYVFSLGLQYYLQK